MLIRVIKLSQASPNKIRSSRLHEEYLANSGQQSISVPPLLNCSLIVIGATIVTVKFTGLVIKPTVGNFLDSSNLGSTTPRVELVDIGFVCVAMDGSRIVTIKGIV